MKKQTQTNNKKELTDSFTYVPREITTIEYGNELVHIATFDFYSGLAYVKAQGCKHTIEFRKVYENSCFIVCCGDIMVRILSTDFPNIIRRPL